MRLTLRTLLAWLDDTLPPVQVREIGKQVGASPLAQELVQRIHRVTRQRRLTVPSKNGPDATDPNLVASYLDNDLNAEQVAEYEKKCLTSDVNLAEAASVHQILSLLGQKVQVPGEAKSRMYLLVKGREAHAGPAVDGEAHEADPRTQPIIPWTVQAPAARHWLEKFGPLAACLALLALLCWSAYESLKSDDRAVEAVAANVPVKAGEGSTAAKPAEPAEAPSPAPPPAVALVEPPAEDADLDDPMEPAKEADDAETAKTADAAEPDAASVEVPAGSDALIARVDGMLLKYDRDQREWVRAERGDEVSAQDRVMVPPPFEGRLATPGGMFDLLADSEVRILPEPADEGPALELIRGRLLAEPSSVARPLHVSYQGQTLDMERPADLAVGFEAASPWAYGGSATEQPALTIHVGPGGELALRTVKAKETIKGPASARINASGNLERLNDATPPDWLVAGSSSAELTDLRERFMKEFTEDRPVLADIVSATESDDPEVKGLAIASLRALGDLSLLTPILDRPEDPIARRAAIAELRTELASGEASARRVGEQLQLDFGANDRNRVGKLLAGYSAEDVERSDPFQQLVDGLSPREESLAVRELAIDNLRRLTGRDAPAYDADKPEPGFAAWRTLLEGGALRPAAKR